MKNNYSLRVIDEIVKKMINKFINSSSYAKDDEIPLFKTSVRNNRLLPFTLHFGISSLQLIQLLMYSSISALFFPPRSPLRLHVFYTQSSTYREQIQLTKKQVRLICDVLAECLHSAMVVVRDTKVHLLKRRTFYFVQPGKSPIVLLSENSWFSID